MYTCNTYSFQVIYEERKFEAVCMVVWPWRGCAICSKSIIHAVFFTSHAMMMIRLHNAFHGGEQTEYFAVCN